MCCLELLKANATKITMPTGPIVEDINVLGNVFSGRLPTSVDTLLDFLLLQSAPAPKPSKVDSSPARADSKMIGTCRVPSFARSALSKPYPWSCVIITSDSQGREALRSRLQEQPGRLLLPVLHSSFPEEVQHSGAYPHYCRPI